MMRRSTTKARRKIITCSALCHLVHAFYNRSTPFLLSLLAAICKINLLKFYDLKLKGNGGYQGN